MASSEASARSSEVWRETFQVVALSVLWLMCVIKLCQSFAHMPLDNRFLFGLGALFLPIAICKETLKLIAHMKARTP